LGNNSRYKNNFKPFKTFSGVIWSLIRPDPKLFGLKDPDLKSLISDPAPATDPPFFIPTYEISFKNVFISEQIHHDYTHNSRKCLKLEDFDPFVSSYEPKLDIFFSPSLVHRRIWIQYPDPKFLIYILRIRIQNC